jgi:pentatricopeptide repeat protein
VCSALVGVWAPSFFLSCVVTVHPSPTSRHLSLFLVSVCAAGIPTLALFVHARGGGWKPDHVAFAVLVKMFGEAGDYDGIHFVFKEMQESASSPTSSSTTLSSRCWARPASPCEARGDMRPTCQRPTAECRTAGKPCLPRTQPVRGNDRRGRRAQRGKKLIGTGTSNVA